MHGAASARTRSWRLDAVTSGGLVLAAVALLGVSGGMLWYAGYNYEGLTGSPATKIHPFTYLMVLLFGWRLLASGNPVGYLVHLSDRRPASLLMLAVAVLMFISVILRGAPGMAGVIDTFIGPALMMMLLADADDRLLAKLETVLHTVMTVNALLGLLEFATKSPIFPYRFDGMAFATDLRSAALQGHPLVNATLTALYIMALLNSGRPTRTGLRLAMIGLQSAALVAFGGRSAMVVTIVLGGAYGLYLMLNTLKAGRIPLLAAAAAALFITAVPMAIVGLAYAGFFDALLERFVSDGGSADARAEMLQLFGYLSWREIIVGPDVGYIASLRRVHGLEWGIENPVINMTLYQGAFMTLVAFIAVALFLAEIARGGKAGVWLPMLTFVILISTFESISSKTTLIAKLTVIVFALYRPLAATYQISVPARRVQGRQAWPDRIAVSGRP